MYITSKKFKQGATNSINDLLGLPNLECSNRAVTILKQYIDINEASLKELNTVTILVRRIANKYNTENMSGFYDTFLIPKKTKGVRVINAPKEILKDDFKTIVKLLENNLKLLPHDSAWAYVKGRSIKGALEEHQSNGSRWFLKIDLKDFFGSCNKDFIKTQLSQIYPIGLKPTLIESITDIAILNGGLPQGTPLSPMLTNLIMIPIDYNINKMLGNFSNTQLKQRYIYTRYADDIIISAKEKFDFKIMIQEIENILKNTPLKINKDKIRFGSFAGRNWNLGLMYNKDKQITIGYRNKQRLKTIIHNYVKDPLWDIQDYRWLLGKLSYLESIEPDYAQGLYNYVHTKYNIDLKQDIINNIKRFN